jgi:hypothetical protein
VIKGKKYYEEKGKREKTMPRCKDILISRNSFTLALFCSNRVVMSD